MERTILLAELAKLFEAELKKGTVNLTEETTANEVDGWTSLTNLLLVNAIERHYGIKFNFREIVKMKCVGDLCNLISKKLEER